MKRKKKTKIEKMNIEIFNFLSKIELAKFDQKNFNLFQKQPSRGVLKKRCSENMQQIYRRTPMRKDLQNTFC